ncbi:hypothetical protein F4680DRAFT_210003 [Xylaria scruposa]|nr:hypothetical protein F4680DRAFT_210003 [Xylaria scruposa]
MDLLNLPAADDGNVDLMDEDDFEDDYGDDFGDDFMDIDEFQAVTDDDRPYSPWAERFGIWRNPEDFDFWPNDPIRHSNAAPSRNPPLDPYFYGDRPSPKGHHEFSSGYEKDRLFVAEYYLKYFLLSIQPWQLGPMTRWLQFSDRTFVPGGHISSLSGDAEEHREVYDEQRIQVDEDSWFPFFKKDNWFSSPGDEPYDPWSVDDPEVWGELRIALELANRILNALIKDKHVFLHTLMFGRLMYWEEARQKLFHDQPPAPFPDTAVLLSYDFYKSQFTKIFPGEPCDMDAVMDKTEEQFRDQLCLLGEGQDWGLATLEHANRSRELGRTYTSERNIILINVQPIRSLIAGEITLAERVELTYGLANTILHEFTHALMASRCKNDDSWLNSTERHVNIYKEPYVDFAPQAEMGYVMESLVFGNPLRHAITAGPDLIYLAAHRKTWPFPDLTKSSNLGQVIQGHPVTAAGVEIKLTLVPSLWFSMILSEEFWGNDLVPRKSDNFFHAMDYFCSRNPLSGNDDDQYKYPPVIEGNPPQTNRGVVDVIADWRLRERIWNQSRVGWFDREQDIWEKSPWGRVYRREMIIQFTKQMKGPIETRDLFICVDNATSQVARVPWWGSRDEYIAGLQNPADWVHHAIGLLMFACLPLRPDFQKREPMYPLIKTHYLRPSSSAPIRVLPQMQSEDPIPLECPQSMHWDPLGEGNGQLYTKGGFDHFSFLDQVLKLVQYFADNFTVVTTPWLDEILRVEEKIRTWRTNMAEALAGGDFDLDSTWAAEAWDFQVPEYDPNAASQWDIILNCWSPVN